MLLKHPCRFWGFNLVTGSVGYAGCPGQQNSSGLRFQAILKQCGFFYTCVFDPVFLFLSCFLFLKRCPVPCSYPCFYSFQRALYPSSWVLKFFNFQDNQSNSLIIFSRKALIILCSKLSIVHSSPASSSCKTISKCLQKPGALELIWITVLYITGSLYVDIFKSKSV